MNLSEQSLNDRIKNCAKETGAKDTNKIRTTLALERLVARFMSNPILEESLVFLGGFILYKEGISSRFTRDVDMISDHADHEFIKNEIIKAINTDIGDGFWFGDIIEEELLDDVLYGGLRLRPLYKAGLPSPSEEEKKKLRRIHLDISFQSLKDLSPRKIDLNSELKDYEALSLKVYPLEFMAADKIHATLSRDGLSTRSKDIYDLSKILNACDKEELKKSINTVFKKRDLEREMNLYESLKNLNTDSLKRNWHKVELLEVNASFETCWKEVLSFFKTF